MMKVDILKRRKKKIKICELSFHFYIFFIRSLCKDDIYYSRCDNGTSSGVLPPGKLWHLKALVLIILH